MTKKELKKAIYEGIFKKQKTHQETFDTLRKDSSMDLESLANEVAKVPSAAKRHKYKTLNLILIVLLGMIILVRSMGIVSLLLIGNIPIALILIALLFGFFVPAMGIYAAITYKMDLYRSTSILFTINLVRTITNKDFDLDTMTLLFSIPTLLSIALALYLPYVYKNKFSKKVIKEEIEGVQKTRINYIFEKDEIQLNSEILDAGI